ncbi:hypothetical protein PFDG_05489 [Plasmodium falciparum Dd2]|uniref:Uncharacterized protein n=1 Tax=Plasmodium falciparum (isolate Dd2) TaxID=57267 RepID=A0A0L7M1M5_PLAF4|nr:hypothetical protein PFDG_05489 [Plasmodium falciparum Dd2]
MNVFMNLTKLKIKHIPQIYNIS